MDIFFGTEFGAWALFALASLLGVVLIAIWLGILQVSGLLKELLEFVKSDIFRDFIKSLEEQAKTTETKVDDRAIQLLSRLPELVNAIDKKTGDGSSS